MKSQMHPERVAADKAVKAAKAAADTATTEQECEMLWAAFEQAIKHSVAMDAKYPTASEVKRAENRQHMNSIGLWNW